MIEFILKYEGGDADNHLLDFYDAAQALDGFQRSLAITTNLVINGNIITQSTSLKNAKILVSPPKEGSWEIATIIVPILGFAYKAGTAPKDTPLGHLIHSAYDYIVSDLLGFHVDYDKTLGQQYEDLGKRGENELPILRQSQFDSAIEKCDNALKAMHRPIVQSGTANYANIFSKIGDKTRQVDHAIDANSYEHLSYTYKSEKPEEIVGAISSYNSNTFRGRIFVDDEIRPIPFTLAIPAQDPESVEKILQSFLLGTRARNGIGHNTGKIKCICFKNYGRTGRLKSYDIVQVV